MAAIIDMADHLGIRIGPVGVVVYPNLLDDGIYLDGVDMAHAKSQRMFNIVAGASANDERILKGRPSGGFLKQVNERIGAAAGSERHHLLVSHIVDGNA